MKLFTSSHSNRLSFNLINYGDRIKTSNFQCKKSSFNSGLINRDYLSIFNIKTNKEYQVTFDILYDDNFAVSEVNQSGHFFIVTSTHTSGSGGYDFHRVFKIEGDNLISIGNKMSCNRDVKKEGDKLIFTEREFHCDDFFEGEDISSTIELK